MRFLDTIIHSIVPHEKHKNIPHLLKKEFVTALSVLVVLLFFVNANNFKIISGLNLTGAIYPAVLADMTNKDRASDGLSSLTWNPVLEQASAMKAQDMVANSYFAHVSPRGVTPWYWFEQAKYDFVYAGENLALDFTESRDVQQAWLDSPTHRANVLSQNYTEIGISAVDGMFEGRNTTFVVEFFGKPQIKNVANVNQSDILASDDAGSDPQPVPTTNNTEPEIAGATAETNIKPTIKIIEQADQVKEKFIGVQNTNATEPAVVTTSIEQGNKYSTWYQRLAVNPTNAIKALYGTILALALASILLVLSKEYQKHHFKHLLMGVLLIVLTGAFLYSIESPSIILAFMQV